MTHLLHTLDHAMTDNMTEGLARLRCRVLVRLGVHILYQGDLATAEAHFRTVTAACDEPHELAIAYAELGKLTRLRGDSHAATDALQRSLGLARTAQNRHQNAETVVGCKKLLG